MIRYTSILAVLLASASIPAASPASEQPAARAGDGTLVPNRTIRIGEPTVIICGRPAARVGDTAVGGILIVIQQQPLAAENVPSPVLPGPILTGSSTVFIGGKPAARIGDRVQVMTQLTSLGPLPKPDSVSPPGCPTVLIGS